MDAEKQLRILAAAAHADGKVVPEERGVLAESAARLGLDESHVEAALAATADGAAPELPKPDDAEAAETLFRDLVAVVVADDDLDSAERRFARRVGRGLRLDKKVVDRILIAAAARSGGAAKRPATGDVVRRGARPSVSPGRQRLAYGCVGCAGLFVLTVGLLFVFNEQVLSALTASAVRSRAAAGDGDSARIEYGRLLSMNGGVDDVALLDAVARAIIIEGLRRDHAYREVTGDVLEVASSSRDPEVRAAIDARFAAITATGAVGPAPNVSLAGALARAGDEKARTWLRKRLASAGSGAGAVDLALELEDASDPAALAWAREVAIHEDSVAAIALVLGEMGDASDLPRLRAIAADERGTDRFYAARPLAEIAGRDPSIREEAAVLVAEFLDDPQAEGSITLDTAAALLGIEGAEARVRRVVEERRGSVTMRQDGNHARTCQAAMELERLGDPAGVELLLEAIEHPASGGFFVSLSYLLYEPDRARPAELLPPLRAALASRSTFSDGARPAVLGAIGQFGDRTDLPELRRVLLAGGPRSDFSNESPDVARRSAAAAIVAILERTGD